MVLEEFEALRARLAQELALRDRRKKEETAHARNTEREAVELEEFIRMGTCRDWDKSRVRLKPVARKTKKQVKSAASAKKH